VRKWVFLSGAGKWVQGDCAKYIVGRFDGERFTPEQESIVIDGGRENYSTQLFSDAPDNRKIFVGWYSRSFGSVGYPGMPANGQFRVPWELTLYKTQNGYRLRRLPVKELASLHGKKHGWPEQKLGAGAEFKADIESRELDIETRIEPGKSGGFDLGLAGMKVAYDASAGKVNAFGRSIDVRPVDGVLTFRILLDRTSVEMFINNGTCVMTGLFMPDDNAPAFSITATSAELLIKGLTIYEMKSMWE